MLNETRLVGLSDRIDRGWLVDAGLITLIVGVLVTAHLAIPSNLKAQLVFDHQAFESWTLFTSAYIHAGVKHLINNVAGFVLAGLLTLILCREVEARWWFHLTSLLFLLLLPILVNLSSYAALGTLFPEAAPTGRGFSGVAAGFVGFVFAAFLVWVAQQSSRTIAQYIGYAVLLVLTLEFALIYVGFRPNVVGLSLLGIAVLMWGLNDEIGLGTMQKQWRNWIAEMMFGLLIVVALIVFVYTLFPANIVSDGLTVNIFAHGAGFLWGTGLALVNWWWFS